MLPLHQTTYENTVTKVEITQKEQFLLLTQCFQLCSIIKLKVVCCRFADVGKGKKHKYCKQNQSYIFGNLGEISFR